MCLLVQPLGCGNCANRSVDCSRVKALICGERLRFMGCLRPTFAATTARTDRRTTVGGVAGSDGASAMRAGPDGIRPDLRCRAERIRRALAALFAGTALTQAA